MHTFNDKAKPAAEEMIRAGNTPAEAAPKLASRFKDPKITSGVVAQWARRGGWVFTPEGGGSGLPASSSDGPIADGASMGGQEPGIDLDDYDTKPVQCSATERQLVSILLARNLRDLHRWADGGWILDPAKRHKLTIGQRIQRTEQLLRKMGGSLPKIPQRRRYDGR